MPRVTVGPKSGGRWRVTGEAGAFPTQAEAIAVARRQQMGSGGELVIAADSSAEAADLPEVPEHQLK